MVQAPTRQLYCKAQRPVGGKGIGRAGEAISCASLGTCSKLTCLEKDSQYIPSVHVHDQIALQNIVAERGIIMFRVDRSGHKTSLCRILVADDASAQNPYARPTDTCSWEKQTPNGENGYPPRRPPRADARCLITLLQRLSGNTWTVGCAFPAGPS